MFVDIHTHNQSSSAFPTIINLNIEDVQKILDSEVKGLYSVGTHPWYINDNSEKEILSLENLLYKDKIVCVGECGLDKNSKVSLPIQHELFRKQIELSEKYHKPLIIHCVGAFNELFVLRKKLKPKQLWIIHGFRGKPELAEQVLKSGCALSFGEHFNEASVRLTPIERLFVETDESNISIEKIYSNIANIKNCSTEQLTAGENLYRQIKVER
ncbi:MAG: TatD family hydrolase [Paludibacter sp.]